MSTTGTNLINQINDAITNYAPKAFHDKRLNSILLQLVAWIDSGGTTGTVVNVPNIVPVTSADFSNATDCPLTTLNGLNLQVYWNESQRFLIKADGEWSDLTGGGFKVLLPSFDSTTATYHFYIYIST